ncbi:MAG: hypothetical protein H7308_11120 [Chthonomonadaceae bacterium]|nr:hypothetical protein [Chthonomonadaceae bacterium]
MWIETSSDLKWHFLSGKATHLACGLEATDWLSQKQMCPDKNFCYSCYIVTLLEGIVTEAPEASKGQPKPEGESVSKKEVVNHVRIEKNKEGIVEAWKSLNESLTAYYDVGSKCFRASQTASKTFVESVTLPAPYMHEILLAKLDQIAISCGGVLEFDKFVVVQQKKRFQSYAGIRHQIRLSFNYTLIYKKSVAALESKKPPQTFALKKPLRRAEQERKTFDFSRSVVSIIAPGSKTGKSETAELGCVVCFALKEQEGETLETFYLHLGGCKPFGESEGICVRTEKEVVANVTPVSNLAPFGNQIQGMKVGASFRFRDITYRLIKAEFGEAIFKKTQTKSRQISGKEKRFEGTGKFLDGSKDLGYLAREEGKFGSLPLFDDYGDESDGKYDQPYDIENYE